MARRRKGAVRSGKGAMCNICGKNCGKGGALKVHIEATHEVPYDAYKKCFYGDDVKTELCNSWDDTVSTKGGNTVITHILVRRFIGDPGERGATRTANPSVKKS